jgi:hypothetical protein
MVRITITEAAHDAIARTLPLGSVAVEPQANERGERLIWLETAMVDRLGAVRGPSESYRDVFCGAIIFQVSEEIGQRLAEWC